MTNIGNDVPGGFVLLSNDAAYAHNLSAYHQTFTEEQEVFKCWLYSGSTSNDGNITAEVGLQNVLNGANNSPLVAGSAQSFTGTSSEGWLEIDLDALNSTFIIPAGTYGCSFWSNGWRVDASGGWVSGNNIKQSAAGGGLPSTFILNDTSYSSGAIAMYFETRPVVATVVINSVQADSIADGDTDVFITGSGFGAAQGTGTLKISAINDINDPDVVTQVIKTWQSGVVISFDVSLPPLQDSEEAGVYLFATDENGVESAGFNVPVTGDTLYENTVIFEDEKGVPTPILSPSGSLSFGFSAFKDNVLAHLVQANNVASTSTLQLNIQWADGLKPVDGDVIRILYDKAGGDLISEDGVIVDSFVLENENVIICP